MSNAIKYSPSGSRVEISLWREQNEAILCVKDQGRGICADDLEQIFHPFATSGPPGTAGEKATGLGLAIARKMVEAHGGRLWVQSQVGQGSSFFVALPFSSSSF